jgi:hypothetical protein
LTCRPFAVRRCWILNANKPDPVTHIVSYNPDLNNPAKAPRDFFVYMGRMTWQANPKNKFGLTYDYEGNCFCPNNVSATRTPEAATDRRFPLQRFVQVDWNSSVSGKVLVEASAIHRVERWGDMALQTGNAGNITALDPTVIGGIFVHHRLAPVQSRLQQCVGSLRKPELRCQPDLLHVHLRRSNRFAPAELRQDSHGCRCEIPEGVGAGLLRHVG